MEESNGSTQSTEAVAITLPGLRLFVQVYFFVAYLYISHSKFFLPLLTPLIPPSM